MRNKLSPGLTVLVLAFLIRIGGVIVTTVTHLNPDSQADAVTFAEMAAAIAAGEVALDTIQIGSTALTWGLFLAPFWLLPGPSIIYARLGNALLGAIAVYNVFLIARYYHSQLAGYLAAAPILLFPSFVAIHSTVLREAIILFGVTTAARLLTVPTHRRLLYEGKSMRWVQPFTRKQFLFRFCAAFGLILVASLFRLENAPIYFSMIAIAASIYLIQWRREAIAVIVVSIPVFYYTYSNYLFSAVSETLLRGRDGMVEFLIWFRGARIREGGRTQYHSDITPETAVELVMYAPVGALYFLYVPFPWMIEVVHDSIVSMEGIIAIVYTIFAVSGILLMSRRNRPVTIGLLGGFILFIILYGLISTNVGTAMRQRQVLYWILTLFGGLGMAEQYQRRGEEIVKDITARVSRDRE